MTNYQQRPLNQDTNETELKVCDEKSDGINTITKLRASKKKKEIQTQEDNYHSLSKLTTKANIKRLPRTSRILRGTVVELAFESETL